MRLFEYEAKDIFRRFGIPVPNGAIAGSPREVDLAVGRVGLPVAIKAQVLVGGRGKAGGIEFADSLKGAVEKAEELMGKKIRGHRVRRVLVEEKLGIKHEYYLGVTIDQLSGRPVVMFSTEGGVDVETIAEERPEALISKRVSLSRGLFQFEARDICQQLGLDGAFLLKVSSILHRLYSVFDQYDALIAEINPLAVTNEDKIYAVDAVLEIDDNSLFRHSDIKLDLSRVEDEIRREATKRGLSYVRLKGDIGVIGSGAGLTMTTIDLIKDFGGEPANFLETGGGITEQLMEGAVELMLRDERLRALLINLYGGINPMPAAAKGIVRAYERLRPEIPILVKLVGNQQEEAWGILESAGIPVVKEIQTEVAVRKLMSMLGG
jgi:succinyl-CoA synthetase beta subunit